MKRIIVAGGVALACLAGAAGAQGQAQPTSAQIVSARQAAFQMSAATLGAIRAELDGGGDPTKLGFTTGALNNWATALPTMFPQGTGSDALGATTHAKPDIWTNRADFDAKAADYVAATAALKAAATSGDAAAANAAFGEVRAACGSCHQAYRG